MLVTIQQTRINARHRLFFAASVNPWCEKIAALQQQLKMALTARQAFSWRPPASFHITLVFIGEISTALKNILHDQMQQHLQTLDVKPFKVVVTGIDFLAHEHLVIRVHSPAFDKLHHWLHDGLQTAGIMLARQRFMPHITLGRARTPAAKQMAQQIIQAQPISKRWPSFLLTDFLLFESYPHCHYVPLCTYPLKGF